jgi:hypothetical protein
VKILTALAILMVPAPLPQTAFAQTITDTLVTTLRIGDDRPDFTFSYIWDVAIDAQGRAYVLDRGSANVRQFDASGRFVRSIGGRGSGPGEFSLVTEIGLDGDTLWFVDSRQRRHTILDSLGKVRGTTPIPRQTGPPSASPIASFGDASTLRCESLRSTDIDQTVDVSLRCFRVSRNGEITDTVARQRFPGAWPVTTTSGSRVNLIQPISTHSLIVMSTDGTRWAIVDRPMASGSNDSVIVRHFGLGNSRPLVTAVAYRAKSVGEADIAPALRMAKAAGAASLADARASLKIPRYVPAIASEGGAIIGRDGSTWLQLRTLDGVRYAVIDKSGKLRTIAVGPSDFEMMDGDSGSVWGVQRDDVDVPSVVRLSLKRRRE